MTYMRRASRGSSASRSPSPSRLTASTVTDRNSAGEQDDVVGDLEQAAPLGHDVAPARDVGRRAGAEKRQDRLDDHRRGADEGAAAPAAAARCWAGCGATGCGNSRCRWRCAASTKGCSRSVSTRPRTRRVTRGTSADGDREDHVLHAGAGQRHQRDREQHRRDRHQPVHDPHHDRVDPAAEAGDQADREARACVAVSATLIPTVSDTRAP